MDDQTSARALLRDSMSPFFLQAVFVNESRTWKFLRTLHARDS